MALKRALNPKGDNVSDLSPRKKAMVHEHAITHAHDALEQLAPTENPKNRLLALPRVLRDMIWSWAIFPSSGIISRMDAAEARHHPEAASAKPARGGWKRPRARRILHSDLLRVTKQLSEEASLALIRDNRVLSDADFCSIGVLPNDPASLRTKTILQHARDIDVHLYQVDLQPLLSNPKPILLLPRYPPATD